MSTTGIIPFVLSPASYVRAKDVSNGAYRLFQCLKTYKNRATGQCNPRRRTLAKVLGVDEATITRRMRELRLAGWVTGHRGLHGWRYDLHDDIERKNAASPRSKNAACPSGKNAAYEAPLPYMNQMFLENQKKKKNTDADAKLRTVVEPEERSAAAAPCEEGRGGEEHAAPQRRPQEARELVEELIPNHPEPGNPGRAVEEAQRLLAASADLEVTIATIRRHHATWRAHWAMLPVERFIPQLWRWFASGEWKYPAPQRKGIQREGYMKRRNQEMAESDQRYYRTLAENEQWDALREYGQDPEVWREKVAG